MPDSQSVGDDPVEKMSRVVVLVVDDDKEDQQMVSDCLKEVRSPGYSVSFASSVAESAELLSQHTFDIILLDLNLPDSRGVASFTKVHERAPQLPIIVLTGQASEDTALKIMRRGGQDYIHKEKIGGPLLSKLMLFAIERKKSQHEIYLAREKYETIFKNSAVAITVTDPDEKIISWNHAAEHLLRMGPDDLYMKPVSSLYSEVEWRKIRSYNIREKGVHQSLETQIIRKDGHVMDADISITVLKDENGRVTGSIGIMKDISDRKRAAREIRRAEEKYRTIFENSAVAITVTDADERIVSWNRFAEEFLGMGYEDLYMRPVGSLYPEEEWAKIRGLEIRKKGIQHMAETKVFSKEGALLDVDVSVSVLKDANGNITGSIGIMKDITERKRLQEMKDDFLSTVSHELRTPISIIRESVCQVKDGILGETNDRQQRVLTMSVNAMDRLARIINDLLDLSKMEACKMELRPEPFDLVALAQELETQFREKAAAKGLGLRVQSASSQLTIEADRDRVIQVFVNLINNAVKFTEEGEIVISVSENNAGMAVCSVADTGRGISEPDRVKVFSKFEQFGRSAPGVEKGTGLGLSICKGIVELHGGEIRVEPNENHGTRFVFTLPVKPQE